MLRPVLVLLLVLGVVSTTSAEPCDTVRVACDAKRTPRIERTLPDGRHLVIPPRRMTADTLRTPHVCFVRMPRLELFLCIGQSNMAGRGQLESRYLDTLAGVFLFNGEESFERAVNPLNRYSTIRKELPMQRVGLSYGFAGAYVAATGAQIGLVVNARGDTSIDKWLPGASEGYFEAAVARIRAAQQWGDVKAILWHQGEADCGRPASYEAKLRRLVDALRAELGDVPFLFGEIAHWNWTRRAEGTEPFNAMLRELPRRINRTACVTAEELSPMKDQTDPHFCASSQVLFGERYAEALLRLLASENDKPNTNR